MDLMFLDNNNSNINVKENTKEIQYDNFIEEIVCISNNLLNIIDNNNVNKKNTSNISMLKHFS